MMNVQITLSHTENRLLSVYPSLQLTTIDNPTQSIQTAQQKIHMYVTDRRLNYINRTSDGNSE